MKKTKNNRLMIVGKCKSCGKQKARFVSSKTGDGLLGNALGLKNGKIPILGDIPLIGALF